LLKFLLPFNFVLTRNMAGRSGRDDKIRLSPVILRPDRAEIAFLRREKQGALVACVPFPPALRGGWKTDDGLDLG
jgi:hypothetical protein